MNRAKKILLSALNAHDNDTVKRLQIPKYESTKGTYPHERDALLINRNVFFSGKFLLFIINNPRTLIIKLVSIYQCSRVILIEMFLLIIEIYWYI